MEIVNLTKICNMCHVEKPINDFSPTSSYKGQPRWRGECKQCNSTLQRKPAAKRAQKKYKTSEHAKAVRVISRAKNRHIELAQDRTPEGTKRKREQKKRLYYSDPLVNLKVRLRARFRQGLTAKNLEKQISVATLIGITLPKFKEYIESMFLPGMSWEVPGSFHIDHHIPLDSAKSEEEMYKLWHYSNLKPMYPLDNLRKSNKVS